MQNNCKNRRYPLKLENFERKKQKAIKIFVKSIIAPFRKKLQSSTTPLFSLSDQMGSFKKPFIKRLEIESPKKALLKVTKWGKKHKISIVKYKGSFKRKRSLMNFLKQKWKFQFHFPIQHSTMSFHTCLTCQIWEYFTTIDIPQKYFTFSSLMSKHFR